MKKTFTGLFVGLGLWAAPLVCHAQVNHVNILPYGDSVTSFGSSPESSYRYWLYVDLTNAGFNNFNFVGTRSGTQDGPPANPLPPEQDGYAGGAGDTTATPLDPGDSTDYAPDVANQTQPNIVLLDFGSNDYDQSQTPKATLGQVRVNLDAIIQDLAAQNPGVIVLLAVPTPWVSSDRGTRKFMSGLGGAVKNAARDEKRAGVRVIVVGLRAGFGARRDTKDDGVHPNVAGEKMIAKKYFNVLRGLLKRM